MCSHPNDSVFLNIYSITEFGTPLILTGILARASCTGIIRNTIYLRVETIFLFCVSLLLNLTDPCENQPLKGQLTSQLSYRRFTSYLLCILLLFLFHLSPSPVHPTGFSLFLPWLPFHFYLVVTEQQLLLHCEHLRSSILSFVDSLSKSDTVRGKELGDNA